MELDFSKLTAMSKPTGDDKQADGKTHAEGQNAPQATQDVPKGIGISKLQRDQENSERAAKVYSEYQKNIMASEVLTSELLKGIKRAESPYSLLLKAIKTISLMTQNKLFYEQAKKDMASVYGEDATKE